MQPDDEVNPLAIKRQMQRKRDLLKRRKELREANGLLFYKPHRKQVLFHEAGNFKYRYGRTGNRFGKSQMGSAEDVAFARGAREWYPEGHPMRYLGIPKRPTKGLIITIDWDKSTEVFTSLEDGINKGKLFQFLPQSAIVSTHRNHSGAIDKIGVKSIHGGISTINIDTVKSYMQNPMSQESSNWDWVHIDEPCPEGMWKAASRGMVDAGGKAWFTCTPLREMWINRFFLPTIRMEHNWDEPYSVGKKWMMQGSMYDNPYLSEEDVKDYEETLTVDERACRILGLPMMLSGIIYKEFSPEKHVYHEAPKGWEAVNEPPPEYTIRVAIDPHPKTPHAVLFAATAPSGEVYFYDEIFQSCMIKELAAMINARVGSRFCIRRICDPSAWIENPVNGVSMAMKMFQEGLYVEKAPKDLSHGILRVNETLKAGNVFFSSHLRETLFEFDNYVWDEKREKPVDQDDHMMENLYRMVLCGLDWIDPNYSSPSIDPITLQGLNLDLP